MATVMKGIRDLQWGMRQLSARHHSSRLRRRGRSSRPRTLLRRAATSVWKAAAHLLSEGRNKSGLLNTTRSWAVMPPFLSAPRMKGQVLLLWCRPLPSSAPMDSTPHRHASPAVPQATRATGHTRLSRHVTPPTLVLHSPETAKACPTAPKNGCAPLAAASPVPRSAPNGIISNTLTRTSSAPTREGISKQRRVSIARRQQRRHRHASLQKS